LGLVVDREMLHTLGMWHRELFYLEQVSEFPLPVAVIGSVPEGFVQVSKNWVTPAQIKEGADRFQSELLRLAWNETYDPEGASEDELFRRIREGASPYGINHFKGLKTVRKMLRLSRRACWQWVFRRTNESVFGRCNMSYGRRVWINQDMLGGCSRHVEFSRGVSVTK